MSRNIGDKTLQEAKEKLACHIEPPGHASKNDADAFSGGASYAAGGQDSFIDSSGRVLLTRMTSAGG